MPSLPPATGRIGSAPKSVDGGKELYASTFRGSVRACYVSASLFPDTARIEESSPQAWLWPSGLHLALPVVGTTQLKTLPLGRFIGPVPTEGIFTKA